MIWFFRHFAVDTSPDEEHHGFDIYWFFNLDIVTILAGIVLLVLAFLFIGVVAGASGIFCTHWRIATLLFQGVTFLYAVRTSRFPACSIRFFLNCISIVLSANIFYLTFFLYCAPLSALPGQNAFSASFEWFLAVGISFFLAYCSILIGRLSDSVLLRFLISSLFFIAMMLFLKTFIAEYGIKLQFVSDLYDISYQSPLYAILSHLYC